MLRQMLLVLVNAFALQLVSFYFQADLFMKAEKVLGPSKILVLPS